VTTGKAHRMAPQVEVVASTGPGPTQRAVFSTIAPADVVTAIVRRIRAAIGLGLLADGDRLPRESDLVEQLGVTSFALREALARLRDEGLIVTRAGKGGGSFVRSGQALEDLAGGDLERLSSPELRDLGDWRRMLASTSAQLAATRRPESTPGRLRQLAGVVAAGESDATVRRAYGRFLTELAAAAQSARMTEAEFSLHEEFDWLLTLALSDEQYCARVAEDLVAISDAIGRRRPHLARRAAESHVDSTTHALIRLRLMRLAAVDRGPSICPPGPGALLEELRRITGIAMQSLEVIAAVATEAHRGQATAEEFRRRLSSSVMSSLASLDLPVHGVGFMAEPNTVPGHGLWMEWWHHVPEGLASDRTHVLDPSRYDFYDYTMVDAFAVPRIDRRRWADGPYFDYGGLDDYIATLSLPVVFEGRFVGVAAADVLIGELERHLAPWLLAVREPAAVINQEDRVIISNTAMWNVGDPISVRAQAEHLELGEFGWSVAVGHPDGEDDGGADRSRGS
jgi:DNA-binding FadR family transcriptional regulator